MATSGTRHCDTDRARAVRALYGLLKGYVVYIATTVALHFFGPWIYRDERKWLVVVFVAAFLVFVWAGVRTGVSRGLATRRAPPSSSRQRVRGVVTWCLWCAATLKVAVFADNIVSRPAATFRSALSDIGGVYAEALSRANEGVDVNQLVKIDTLAAAITQAALLGGFYFFPELRRIGKALLLVLVAAIIANALMFRGTQIVFCNIGMYWLTAHAVRCARAGERVIDRKASVVLAAFVLVVAIVQAGRLSTFGVASGRDISVTPLLSINSDHPMFALLGQSGGLLVAVMLLYVSMGYYGLSLCLGQEFVWTRGLGSSFALSSYAEQYFGWRSQLESTYPLRAESAHGWPALMYWQTAFPWLASDLTWAGSLLWFAAAGYVFALAYQEAVRFENLASMLMVANLAIMWVFVPANNQLFQSRESLVGCVVVAAVWLLWRKRLDVRPDPGDALLRRASRRVSR